MGGGRGGGGGGGEGGGLKQKTQKSTKGFKMSEKSVTRPCDKSG